MKLLEEQPDYAEPIARVYDSRPDYYDRKATRESLPEATGILAAIGISLPFIALLAAVLVWAL